MTPGTRLLEALTAWIDAPDRFARDGLEADVIDAFGAVSTARALYPAAHAIGDRVSVSARPDEDILRELRLPFEGEVTAITFHESGVRYEVRRSQAGFVDVEAEFVHAVAGTPTPYVAAIDDDLSPKQRAKLASSAYGQKPWADKVVATQPLCPSRSEGSPLLMCEGLADHAGPHHALARTVTW